MLARRGNGLEQLTYQGCGITDFNTMGAGVDKYRAYPLPKPPRGFDRAAIFNLLQDLKQELLINFCERHRTQYREYISFETCNDILGVHWFPMRLS